MASRSSTRTPRAEDVAGGVVDGGRSQGGGQLLLLGRSGRAAGGPEGVGGQGTATRSISAGQGPAGVSQSAGVAGHGLVLGVAQVGAGGPETLDGVGILPGQLVRAQAVTDGLRRACTSAAASFSPAFFSSLTSWFLAGVNSSSGRAKSRVDRLFAPGMGGGYALLRRLLPAFAFDADLDAAFDARFRAGARFRVVLGRHFAAAPPFGAFFRTLRGWPPVRPAGRRPCRSPPGPPR